jgi:hypothetical protein
MVVVEGMVGYPVREADKTDASSVSDCGGELGARDVGAERRLHDAVVEPQDAPPPARHLASHVAMSQLTICVGAGPKLPVQSCKCQMFGCGRAESGGRFK